MVLLGFAALAINIGDFRVAASELQTASDSAALAGAWELNATPEGLDAARAKAIEYAAKHSAFHKPITDVVDGDVTPCRWDFDTSPPCEPETDPKKINAVKVWTYRNDYKGTAMDGWFGGVGAYFGFGKGQEKRMATAVGLGPSGCANAFPLTVPDCLIPKDSNGAPICDGTTQIQLSNDVIDNGGLTSLDTEHAASTNYVNDLIKNYDPSKGCDGGGGENPIRVMNGNPREPVGKTIRDYMMGGQLVLTPETAVRVCLPVIDEGVPCDQVKFNQDH